jgi:NADP-dependent 3-hydroxy acid dehydrogenase YdfG/pimeloyl-ACP methyl ester carboxylesterase
VPNTLRDRVVVITGASSGIGRATAYAFAVRGAVLVLAARREQALEKLAAECQRCGAPRALAVATDVTDEAAVQALAQAAVEAFRRIDIWVNNAAVTLFGRCEETPLEPFRRVVETNFFGYVYGARAAVPYFREQGRGVLINVASVAGTVGQPYTSAYVASKWAVRGFSECLRQELRDARGIRVCSVLPASIDTPLFQHAANYTGRAVKPMDPVYAADDVARAIVELAVRPRRELTIGRGGRLLTLMHTLWPGVAEGVLAEQVERDHFREGVPAPQTAGNLFEPSPIPATVSGGWRAASAGTDGRAGQPGAKLQSRWTFVDGLRMHARVSTDPVGPDSLPLVLVHGVGVASRYFVPTAERLARHYRVYVPDLPGFGASDKPPRALGLVELADVLDHWMHAVGLDRGIILGNSVGCQIVAHLAVRHPMRAERLILVGPTMDPAARTAVRVIGRWLRNNRRERVSQIPISLSDYAAAGVGRVWRTFRYALRDRLEEQLPRIGTPTLVVRGGLDAIVSQDWAEEVTRLLPNARLVVVPGKAHTLNYNAPEDLAREVRRFVQDHQIVPIGV